MMDDAAMLLRYQFHVLFFPRFLFPLLSLLGVSLVARDWNGGGVFFFSFFGFFVFLVLFPNSILLQILGFDSFLSVAFYFFYFL